MQSAMEPDETQRAQGEPLSQRSFRLWQGMHTNTRRLRFCALTWPSAVPLGSMMEKVEK